MHAQFSSILIANRGEVALRILRTAKRCGYRVIAVYSDADANAAWLAQADMALRIGPASAAESYLNIAAILQAAKSSGAQAIHPGYGFLAENPAFAQAVQAAGLVWIGPPVAAMQAMGNKAQAKRRLQESAVPLLPGYQGLQQDLPYLASQAREIGLPLMIKAQAGGGGRGMRLVSEWTQLESALASARSEAQLAFGNGDLILERALIAPRHIEVQIFADAHGNLVHLGERECSLQRRHQKLVEESPSPAVDSDLRARLGEAAIAAAKNCDYLGAGTVEFLLEQNAEGQSQFWFMEMNTRLQVEHCVTEEICGVDLVEWQLLVANGAQLPLSQAQIDARLQQGGHAIEVRLCAEDAQQDFLPQAGQIGLWQAPTSVRCEHALQTGEVVSSHYDSMLAKIIAHGETREQARRKLLQALAETHLLGLAHNLDFLQNCIAHPAFASGQLSTHFIAQYQRELLQLAELPLAQAACAVLALERIAPRYPDELAGWASNARLQWRCRFALGAEQFQADWQATGGASWQLQIGARSWQVALKQGAAPQTWQVEIDGIRHSMQLFQQQHNIWLALQSATGGQTRCIQNLNHLPANAQAKQQDQRVIRAPMNARVVRIAVADGQSVQQGEVLLVLEAMKMEHAMRAPRAGKVSQLTLSLGQQVSVGQSLLEVLD